MLRHSKFLLAYGDLRITLLARRLAALLRRHERHHIPRPDLLLRREARRGPARQLPRRLVPPLEGHLREQASRQHNADPLPEQVRLVGEEAEGGREI